MGPAPAVEDSHMSERVRFEAQETAAEAYGVSTIYEAAGRSGMIDFELIAILPNARGWRRVRARCCADGTITSWCQAAIAHVRSGAILVIRMPESRPVSMLGGLLAEQCVARGVKGVLVDAAIRNVIEIRALGLPVWTRHERAQRREEGGRLARRAAGDRRSDDRGR